MSKGADDSTESACAPLSRPRESTEVIVSTHRELLAMARTLAERLAEDPDFSVMLLANPVLALREYGVRLTPDMEHHVLTTLRHPPALRTRREELEAKLREELHQTPKPTDPKWLAKLVFDIRKIAPRDIEGLQPVYKPALNADMIASIQSGLPAATSNRYPGVRHFKVAYSMGVVATSPRVRQLDLDVPLPEMKPSDTTPTELTLEQGWFYKDDPVVHDAVELGVIMRRGFPFRTPAEFRDLAAGKRADAFRTFVRAVGLESATRS